MINAAHAYRFHRRRTDRSTAKAACTIVESVHSSYRMADVVHRHRCNWFGTRRGRDLTGSGPCYRSTGPDLHRVGTSRVPRHKSAGPVGGSSARDRVYGVSHTLRIRTDTAGAKLVGLAANHQSVGTTAPHAAQSRPRGEHVIKSANRLYQHRQIRSGQRRRADVA